MKTTKLLGALLCSAVLFSCGKEEINSPTNTQQFNIDLSISEPITPLEGEALSKNEINAQVQSSLDRGEIFNWKNVDDKTLWSAVVQSDSLVSVGYSPAHLVDLEDIIHEIDVKSGEWKAIYDALTNYTLENVKEVTQNQTLELKEILAYGEKPLPYFNVYLSDYETIATLRKMGVVRYVEPMGYGSEVQLRDFGCGSNVGANAPSADFSTVSPNAKVSWNYEYMNIEEAWNYSQGDNITLGLIDTGISPSQTKLNSQFASDESTGRYREKHGTYEECWWWWCWNDGPDDDCGHGTSMAGVMAGPRTDNGSAAGIAYKANLVSVRGTDDVVINSSSEKDGVSDAYYYLGNRGDVKIISASLGDVFYSGQVADAVKYAYNRGKLIFAAAGTSTSWTNWVGVIFPATMSQTTAITGVTDGSSLQRCDNCHSGSQVEFVTVMQRSGNDERTNLTLAQSGTDPSYVGGSSVATATAAGVAALIWAQNPNMSRSQVLQKMKESASNYPARNSQYGWGIINAEDAVVSAQ